MTKMNTSKLKNNNSLGQPAWESNDIPDKESREMMPIMVYHYNGEKCLNLSYQSEQELKKEAFSLEHTGYISGKIYFAGEIYPVMVFCTHKPLTMAFEAWKVRGIRNSKYVFLTDI